MLFRSRAIEEPCEPRRPPRRGFAVVARRGAPSASIACLVQAAVEAPMEVPGVWDATAVAGATGSPAAACWPPCGGRSTGATDVASHALRLRPISTFIEGSLCASTRPVRSGRLSWPYDPTYQHRSVTPSTSRAYGTHSSLSPGRTAWPNESTLRDRAQLGDLLVDDGSWCIAPREIGRAHV